MHYAKVGYCRVNVGAEEALQGQIDKVSAYGVDLILSDVLAGRPQYERLMSMVNAGEIGEVVCSRIDRLTRSTEQLLRLSDLVEATNTVFTFTEQPIGNALGKNIFKSMIIPA